MDGEDELTPASFDERAAAFLIDLLIVRMAAMAAMLSFGAATRWRYEAEPVAAAFTVLFFLGLAAYQAYFLSRTGATPGKRFMGIKVVALKGELGAGRAVLRTAAYPLSLAPLGLGFFWMLVDGSSRAWQDLLAGTAVVREGAERRRGRAAALALLSLFALASLLSRLLR